jgi:hypothetical protein
MKVDGTLGLYDLRQTMVGLFILSLVFIGFGVSGFTARGLLFATNKRLTGRKGRIVGSLCLCVGFLGIITAFWFGSPVERQAMKYMSYGLVMGIMGTISVLRGGD